MTSFGLIGSASGMVFVAKTLATGKKVAIKQMELSEQPRKELIVNEIVVMKESHHPNVVNYLDSFLVKSSELWVIMEYMEGGALTDVIENNKLGESQIAAICLEVSYLLHALPVLMDQTCRGLQHLHSRSIIHRDIKSDNLLMNTAGEVKISTSSASLPSIQLTIQPISVSAPSSQIPNPNEQQWSVHHTGWHQK